MYICNIVVIGKRIIEIMYKIDNIDIKIVDLLMEDGRMACSEIARRIGGVTERAIRYRLDRLIAE